MDRIPSELEFQRALQEASALLDPSSSSPPSDPPPPPQPVEKVSSNTAPIVGAPPPPPYVTESYLKSRLDLACAAFALTRGKDLGMGEEKDGGTAALGIPDPAMQNVSDDDDHDDDQYQVEVEVEEEEDVGAPPDAKRAKRLESNRKSARRSRMRKQALTVAMETQVAKLKDEHSFVTNHFANVSQDLYEETVDNRVLRANVETMIAKVKMAEHNLTASNIPFPPFSGTDAAAAFLLQHDPPFQTTMPNIPHLANYVQHNNGTAAPSASGLTHIPHLHNGYVQHNHPSPDLRNNGTPPSGSCTGWGTTFLP